MPERYHDTKVSIYRLGNLKTLQQHFQELCLDHKEASPECAQTLKFLNIPNPYVLPQFTMTSPKLVKPRD